MAEAYHGEQKKKKLEYQEAMLQKLPQYVRDYVVAITISNMSITTTLSYVYDIHSFFTYLSELKEYSTYTTKTIPLELLESLSVEDIELYLFHVSKTNGPHGTARRLASIRKFYQYLFRRGKIKTNPPRLIDNIEIKRKEIIRLQEHEITALINCVETGSQLTERQQKFNKRTCLRDKALLLLLLGTGIRVSECASLDLSDVDFTMGTISIIRKGGDADSLKLPPITINALQEYINTERASLIKMDEASPALFLTLKKERLGVRSIEKLVKKYSQAAKIPKNITPHKMRSTFATNLYNATGDIMATSHALGHSSIQTTRDYYAKVEESTKDKIKDTTQEILSNLIYKNE